MEGVYINSGMPYMLDADGTLDLSSLRLRSISLQGVYGLVDQDTSRTKRSWETTKAALKAFLKEKCPDVLGSELSPLQVKGESQSEAGPRPIDTSQGDFARLFDGEPQVPQSRDEFQKLLRTGKIPLRPSIHCSFVEAYPDLADSVFAAGSEASRLASTMTNLVIDFSSATGKSEELTGQTMTAFTAKLWERLENYAFSHYALSFDRNSMPGKSTTDATPTEGKTRPDLIVSIQRLLLFVGEEKAAKVGRLAALRDLVAKLKSGLPPLFYQDIPYMPVYAAAGDEIQFGFLRANGTVEMAEQVFNLIRPRDRVMCLLASVAIYRLFADLLKLAPDQSRRTIFYLPIARSNSTYITYIFDKCGDAGTVVWKEIFQPEAYFARYRLQFEHLKAAYELAISSDHMVHANRGPVLQYRSHPETSEKQSAYYVQLTTVGSPRELCSWTLPDLRAAVSALLHAAELLHGKGLVHTDLRAANILWRHGTPFLTDLEQVHEAGFEARDLKFVSWTSGTLDENGCYTERSDMEQIGVLMQRWQTASEQQLGGPARSLMEALITKSLSAHEALQHKWFM